MFTQKTTEVLATEVVFWILNSRTMKYIIFHLRLILGHSFNNVITLHDTTSVTQSLNILVVSSRNKGTVGGAA
jgi:hypothetical protein